MIDQMPLGSKNKKWHAWFIYLSFYILTSKIWFIFLDLSLSHFFLQITLNSFGIYQSKISDTIIIIIILHFLAESQGMREIKKSNQSIVSLFVLHTLLFLSTLLFLPCTLTFSFFPLPLYLYTVLSLILIWFLFLSLSSFSPLLHYLPVFLSPFLILHFSLVSLINTQRLSLSLYLSSKIHTELNLVWHKATIVHYLIMNEFTTKTN